MPASSDRTQNRPTHYLQARAQRNIQYEYRTITVPSQMNKSQAHSMITLEADTGKWELARTVIYQGGTTRYWLRRKVLLVHDNA